MKNRFFPGCLCCGCPDETCYDASGNSSSQQINELTYVFTGFPTDLVYHREERDGTGALLESTRVTIFGFNAFEGTYVVSKDADCNWTTNRTHEQVLSYQVEKLVFGDSACSIQDSGTASVYFLLGPDARFVGSNELHDAYLDESNVPTLRTSPVIVQKYINGTQNSVVPFRLTRIPFPIRCDYQDLEMEVVDKSGESCPVTGATYTGSTSTVTG